MSRLAGASCKSILYCRPEQPPPTTATRRTPLGRPCLARRVVTFRAALEVSLTNRSSPVRKAGGPGALAILFAIIECLSPLREFDLSGECRAELGNLQRARSVTIHELH